MSQKIEEKDKKNGMITDLGSEQHSDVLEFEFDSPDFTMEPVIKERVIVSARIPGRDAW
jgi:hypothetical protein